MLGELVETLIRLGELDTIGEASRDRWYRKFLVEAEARVRKQSLAVLTLHPSGRTFLRARTETLDRSNPLRAEFIQALHSRALAAQQTRRFEFMSESESAALLEFTK